MGFPAIIKAGNILDELIHGSRAIVDGRNGVLIFEPDEQTERLYK